MIEKIGLAVEFKHFLVVVQSVLYGFLRMETRIFRKSEPSQYRFETIYITKVLENVHYTVHIVCVNLVRLYGLVF